MFLILYLWKKQTDMLDYMDLPFPAPCNPILVDRLYEDPNRIIRKFIVTGFYSQAFYVTNSDGVLIDIENYEIPSDFQIVKREIVTGREINHCKASGAFTLDAGQPIFLRYIDLYGEQHAYRFSMRCNQFPWFYGQEIAVSDLP